MWPFGQKKEQSEHEDLNWYEIGKDNPFNDRILDLRPFTLNIIATTKDPAIAANFTASRNDDGKQFRDRSFQNPVSIPTELEYPHNDEKLEGIVFQAPEMEVKWDIFVYDDWFYFVRSWTSELIYKARYTSNDKALTITEIVTDNEPDDNGNITELDDEDKSLAVQNVHSIFMTHGFNQVWPFPIPAGFDETMKQDIAIYMFSQFGSKATLGTFANTVLIQLAD